MSAADSTLLPWARRTVWLLPVWAGFLALSTITHQPDTATEFDAYADDVTTMPFLIGHLVLSILGAGLAVIGGAALAVLVAGARQGRAGLRGYGAFALGNVLATAVFGVAAFFQPAIGRAFHDGVAASVDINADVYGTPLKMTVLVGMVSMILGAVWLTQAVRSALPGLPRWVTRTMVWSLPPFVLTGAAGLPVQPLFAVALTVALTVAVRELVALRPALPVGIR